MGPQSSLIIGSALGEGGFGRVHLATWRGQQCAVKTVRLGEYQTAQSAIQQEINVLQSLRHRNIIQYYATENIDDQLDLVMDYAEGGSLSRAIREETLNWPTKYRIAHEIALGLAFIHISGILHCDLKSTNVLLTRNMEVRLCNFGLSMQLQTSSSDARSTHDQHLQHRGTPRWMAPELLTTEPKFSTKSDMYAFGMVMWEMAANCTTPFRFISSTRLVIPAILDGEREDIPIDTPSEFRAWIERCWQQDPSLRPDANEVVLVETESVGDDRTDELALTVTGDIFPTREVPSTYDYDESDTSFSERRTQVDLFQLKQKAEQNDANAQFELAERCERGADDDSLEDAFFWYLRAARQKHPKAQYRLGEIYLRGSSTTPKSYAVAALWIHRAALLGLADAQFSLALIYVRGHGVEKSDIVATDWCQQAAQQGHCLAQQLLADMFRKGQGFVRSYPDAVAWYTKAAEQGDPNAQFKLGMMIKNGQGVSERDDAGAVPWLENAAAQNHEAAISVLQSMYKRNPALASTFASLRRPRNAGTQLCVRQTPKDEQEVKAQGIGVVEWYREATKLSAARAQNDLGWMYENERGAGKSISLAVQLYRKAAQQGEPTAQFNFGLVLEEGRGSGAFGTVHRVIWESKVYAAKKFFLTETDYNKASINKEIRILKNLRHPHIIEFYDVLFHENTLYLLMALAKCSLRTAIEDNELQDWFTKTRIAHQIAQSLQYIHKKKIQHRDLKSDNVLLTENLEVRLCDFGLSKIKQISASRSNGARIGTLRWMAPELLGSRPAFSEKSDIYALGTVMWEMAANCTRPFKHQPHDDALIALVLNGEREVIPDDTPDELRRWIEMCWSQEPCDRPFAHEIVFAGIETQHDDSGDSGHLSPGSDSDIPSDLYATIDSKRTLRDLYVGSPSSFSAQNGATSYGTTVVISQSWEDGKVDDIKTLTLRADNYDDTAQVALAIKYEKGEGVAQNDSEAFFWYRRAADQGHAGAQFAVARMYLEGRGVQQSAQDASKWFHEAAARGNVRAWRFLGIMYYSGKGVDVDPRKACDCFHTAAEGGDTHARHLLADLYKDGRGVEQSDDKAVLLYSQAAEEGDIEALMKLGRMLRVGDGAQGSDEGAFRCFHSAAQLKNAEAQYEIGMMYQTGAGVGMSVTQSYTWLLEAANQGHSEAQFALGLMYETGKGVDQDDAKALGWYRTAAGQGHTMAQFSLGLMYQHGHGAEEDDAKAVQWFRMAADLGHADSQFCLGLMLHTGGEGVDADAKEAISWLLKAAHQGNTSAQYELGTIYLYGRGVEQSDEEAIKWFRKAAGEIPQDGHDEEDDS
ncbi:hypothetical protein BGZ73_009211 [Actinomortierella ambigua]|nr:hypothetical protein BGZ73_009211 [Actinomortierella ambigua]